MPLTRTRPQPIRLYQRREQRRPIVAGRVAGCRTQSPHDTIYFGSSDAYGTLGDASWYPLHNRPRLDAHEVGRWRICADVAGHSVFLLAVQDDFGNLVALS